MRVIALLLALASLASAASTTVSGTVTDAAGNNITGTAYISWPSFIEPDGELVVAGQLQTTITNGALSVALAPNTGSTPTGTSYSVRIISSDRQYAGQETWVVPNTGTATISTVRVSSTPTPSVTITPSQITQGGATSGECLAWNGTSWDPASCGAGGGLASTDIDTYSEINTIVADVTLTHNGLIDTFAELDAVVADQTLVHSASNIATATALAANGANCSANSAAGGVDASGAAEDCIAYLPLAGGTMTGDVTFAEGVEHDASEVVVYVQKGSAGTITAGQVVTLTGYDVGADAAEVELADADDASLMPAFGVAIDSITQTVSGRVVVQGDATGLDTSSWSAGDELYISATAGTLTTTIPTGESADIQRVGTVQRSHVSLGIIEVSAAAAARAPNLDSGNIFVGSASNAAAAVAVSGDATLSNTGALSLAADSVSADELNALGVEAELEAVLDLQDMQGAVTDAQVPDDVTVTLAATATALAANGANCSAGQYPLGVDASGAVESCTAVSGGTPGGSSGQVQYNSSGSFAGDADLTFDGDFLSLGAASTKGLKFGTAMQATLSGGYLEWKDPTAATGATKFRVTKGAGDSTSTNIFFINDGSSDALTINARGDIVSRSIEVTAFAKYQSVWEFGSAKVEFKDTFLLGWASGSNINTTSEDVGLARDAAGVLRVSDGSTGYAKLRVNAFDINDGGTRPTCDSSVRGTFWIDEGGAGVKDDVAVCAKDSGDAYAWRTIY